MRFFYTFSFSILLVFFTNAQDSKNVLFLGNSYTGVNNLPAIISSVATSAGDQITFDSNTPGGLTFQGHTTNATSLSKIAQGGWDYVVLQEQSQMPSLPNSYVQNNVYPYAQSLKNTIKTHNGCAQILFYMTWGRQNGDQSNCASWPPVCTYEGMDDLLQLRYMTMATTNDASVSPVGAVWRYLRANNPEINLYSSDESHPSLAGSYAAACTFYSAIFRKSPMLITDNYSLSNAEASAIRFAVKTVVSDNFSQWFVGKYDPLAQFNHSSEDYTVQFDNSSNYSSDYVWDFGDGTTSTEQNPSHTFATNGIYNVTLTATNCGLSDAMTIPITISQLNFKNFAFADVTAFPNPTSEDFFINSTGFDNLMMSDLLGKIYSVKVSTENNKTKIDCSNLSAGLYVLSISKDGIQNNIKIIVR